MVWMYLQMGLDEISTSFRAGSDTRGIMPYVVLTIVPVLAAIGITLFYQHNRGFLPALKSVDRLFMELCQAHELARKEVRVLRKMAAILDLTNPSCLFVFESKFEQASAALAKLDNSTKTATEIDLIRSRLFGTREAKASK